MGTDQTRERPTIGFLLFLAGFFIFTIVFIAESGELRPASALFPRIALILLLLLLIAKGLTFVSPRLHRIFAATAAELVEYRLDGQTSGTENGDDAAAKAQDPLLVPGSPWVVTSWYTLAVVLVYLAGHRLAVPVVLFAFLTLYGRQKVWVSALVAAALWAFIYFAFEVGMKARLWEGVVWGWL